MAKLLSKNTVPINIGAKAYAELRSTVIKEGILDRDYLFYGLMEAGLASAFILCVYLLFHTTAVPFMIILSALTAFFMVQFVATNLHDGAHQAIFKSKWANNLVGTIASCIFGMGFSQWKLKHNQHHAHPNQEEADPDIDIPIITLTKERYSKKTGLGKFLAQHQVFVYYLLGLFVFASFRIRGYIYFFTHFKPSLIPEMLLCFAGCICWFIGPFLIFDLEKAIIFSVVANAFTGLYMFNIFAPNHKGMPHLAKDAKLSFIEQQILTSRNIRGNWFNDFFYIGLNYQIEHHLFPSCPRNKLKRITPHVLKVCKKLNLEYSVVGPLELNRLLLADLYAISK